MLKQVKGPTYTSNIPPDEHRHQIWKYLVEIYTKRNFTLASDRLHALAGIANKNGEAWADGYYTGTSEQQLLPSLTWRRSNLRPQPHYPRLSEYRAPSWSWASIDGPVEFDVGFDIGNARGLRAKFLSCIFDMDSKTKDIVTLEASTIPIAAIARPDAAGMGTFYPDDHVENAWP